MTVSLAKNSLASVVAEANALKLEIARLNGELAERNAYLAKAVGEVTGRHLTEAGSFTVSENNTYSEDAMRANMLPGQVKRCSVSKLDKAAVKRLYPEVYSAAKQPHGVKVTLG